MIRFHTLGTARTVARDITAQDELLRTIDALGEVTTQLSTIGMTTVKGRACVACCEPLADETGAVSLALLFGALPVLLVLLPMLVHALAAVRTAAAVLGN